MSSLAPFEALQGEVVALSRRLAELEGRFNQGEMLPGRLALLAVDAQILDGVCLKHGLSVACARQRPRIAALLKQRGWTATRIGRMMGISEKKVRAHLRRARTAARAHSPLLGE